MISSRDRRAHRLVRLAAVAFALLPAATRGADIIDLQPFKEVTTAKTDGGPAAGATVTLVNLNRGIGAWFVLDVTPAGGRRRRYHLENPAPAAQAVSLDTRNPESLLISSPGGVFTCDLAGKTNGGDTELEAARGTKAPYVPICEGRLFLLNETVGHQSQKERGVEYLRTYVWGGERIATFFKNRYFRDSELLNSEVGRDVSAPRKLPVSVLALLALPQQPSPSNAAPTAVKRVSVSPPSALIDPAYARATLTPSEFGIELDDSPAGDPLLAGAWHRTLNNPGVYVSIIEPRLVAKAILGSHLDRVRPLDSVESAALTYMVAFDLSAFEMGYALGTEHPKVTWAPRTPSKMRDSRLPGPDGIGSIDPLVSTGVVPPNLLSGVVAAFTSGFKREHGAFMYGPLAAVNHASHYGFIANGVVFSTLQPGLATIIVRNDGQVEMKTWTKADNSSLSTIRHARQNGVALIDYNPETEESEPGAYVNQWGEGNWSGSVEGEQRALRAGLCMLETDGRKYLIYGYFSSVTPSAMARVFQAYRCQYAFHLDMNALEHTYLALFNGQAKSLAVEHLITGMSVLDAVGHGHVAPRFVAEPDNRDFFYMVRKGQSL